MENNYNSLYRTFRPLSFADIAGHQNIVEILRSELKEHRFSHAFLFSGQRGTGKTSTARILAKAFNCLDLKDGNPCNECTNCLAFNAGNFADVYEIDAASNNGVDEIRNIKANIFTLPIVGQYKVYIIDEVHMLTKGAFNALLKTLEEPPTHAVFILATTEYDKIPQTIISRCQTFNFKKISNHDLTKRLEFVTQQEGFSVDREVYDEIYALSDGSLRDALNVLEQLMIIANDKKHITISQLQEIFYVATKADKLKLLQEVLNQDSAYVINYFRKAQEQGLDFDVFTGSLIKLLKEIIEYQLTHDKGLLEELNLEDVKGFYLVPTQDLFVIVDNLAEAYSKTYHNTITYDYMVLSLLKGMENLHQVQQPIMMKREGSKKVLKVEEVVDHGQMFKNNDVEVIYDEKTYTSNGNMKQELNNDETKSVENEPKKVVKSVFEKIETKVELPDTVSTPVDLLNIQSILMNQQNEIQNQSFLSGELLNVLLGAIHDRQPGLKKNLDHRFEELFEVNGVDKLAHPVKAKEFAIFYNSKLVAANHNEIILTVSDNVTADFLNHALLDNQLREDLFIELGNAYAIFVISDQKYKEIKNNYKELKLHDQLPIYKELNVDQFYEMRLKRNLRPENSTKQEFVDKVSSLLDMDDIKIGK
jgi:DNA polymerase-3 subunit gamma/tau